MVKDDQDTNTDCRHWLGPRSVAQRYQVIDFKNCLRSRNQKWFPEQHKLGWWSMHADSKSPSCVSRVFIVIAFIFIASCVNCKFLPDKKSQSHPLKGFWK